MNSYNIIPKSENIKKGFFYTVSEEQIKQHQKRSIKEIFEWLESTSKFIYSVQTPEERERINSQKNEGGK